MTGAAAPLGGLVGPSGPATRPDARLEARSEASNGRSAGRDFASLVLLDQPAEPPLADRAGGAAGQEPEAAAVDGSEAAEGTETPAAPAADAQPEAGRPQDLGEEPMAGLLVARPGPGGADAAGLVLALAGATAPVATQAAAPGPAAAPAAAGVAVPRSQADGAAGPAARAMPVAAPATVPAALGAAEGRVAAAWQAASLASRAGVAAVDLVRPGQVTTALTGFPTSAQVPGADGPQGVITPAPGFVAGLDGAGKGTNPGVGPGVAGRSGSLPAPGAAAPQVQPGALLSAIPTTLGTPPVRLDLEADRTGQAAAPVPGTGLPGPAVIAEGPSGIPPTAAGTPVPTTPGPAPKAAMAEAGRPDPVVPAPGQPRDAAGLATQPGLPPAPVPALATPPGATATPIPTAALAAAGMPGAVPGLNTGARPAPPPSWSAQGRVEGARGQVRPGRESDRAGLAAPAPTRPEMPAWPRVARPEAQPPAFSGLEAGPLAAEGLWAEGSARADAPWASPAGPSPETSPGPGPGPGPGTTSEAARHIARLAAAFVAGGGGPGDGSILLPSEGLGELRLTIEDGGTGLRIAIEAQRPETADLMRRNLDQLVEELRAEGLGDVSVSIDARAGRDGRQDPSADLRPPVPPPERAPDPQPIRPGSLASSLSPQPAAAGQLDLRL